LDDFGNDVSAPLLNPNDDLFARGTTPSLPAGLSPANVGIVNFDDTSKLVLEVISWPHGFSNLHCHSPRGLVGNAKGSLKLFSGYALSGVNHQPDSDKPLLERSPGAVEDSPRSYRELVSTSRTLPDLPLLDPIGMFGPAPGATNTIGPTLLTKEDLALVLGGEPFLEFENIHANHLRNKCSTNVVLCQGDKA